MSDYYACDATPAAVKSVAEAYGFSLVKGVFSAGEMESLEQDLATAHTELGGQMPDLASIPALQWLLHDPRITDIARALLGDTLVYYRETAAGYERVPGALTRNTFAEYHCDARGTAEDLWKIPRHLDRLYPAYRFAIYFRDYRKFSGGLKVAPGSHLRDHRVDSACNQPEYMKQIPRIPLAIGNAAVHLPIPPMELYNVPSEPGDIVIFSLRCFHSAGALRFKHRPTFSLFPSYEKFTQENAPYICEPVAPGARNAIFFDFGAPTDLLDYYVKWRALVSPADLRHAFNYQSISLPKNTILRNDRIIIPLAQRIVDDGPEAGQRQLAQDLVTLCDSHTEFASEHALFDRDVLQRSVERPHAAHDLARDIVGRRDARIAASPSPISK
jgi:hypothetical protein